MKNEIEIPEGCSAKIVGNKVVFEQKESEDERIRKRLIDCLKFSLKGAEEQDAAGCNRQKDIEAYKWGIVYLEKQKEQKPLSTEETELNSIAFLEQLGYTCVPPGAEQKHIEGVIKNITKNKEAATKFLKSAGIIDDNGDLAEMYRSEQKPAEWSEEDEKNINWLIEQFDFLQPHKEGFYVLKVRPWLVSLPTRFNSYPHWKPSEEQMYILNWVANILLNHDCIVEEEAAKKLQSLYNDLKKL